MPIAFDRIDDIPQMHIFIVAAGGYPYLTGGAQAQATRDPELNGLGQLTSPAATAVALHHKFLEFHGQDRWITPLGSIRLLISAPDGAAIPAGLSSGEPTMNNIMSHYTEWFNLCNTHNDNVALFYFCGHGLEKGDHFLLASDFNEHPQQPWRNAFSFDDTRLAFYSCRAETQLFFADACRMHSEDMRGLRLLIPGLDTANEEYNECPYDMTMRSAARNQAAHGYPNQASNFAKALLSGLAGQSASQNHEQEWVVETNTLGTSIKDIMRSDPMSARTSIRTPALLGDAKAILRLPAPPLIPLTVTCDPDAALEHASFACANMDGPVDHRHVPVNSPWELSLSPGSYRLNATFAGTHYQPGQLDTLVVPPLRKETIKCR